MNSEIIKENEYLKLMRFNDEYYIFANKPNDSKKTKQYKYWKYYNDQMAFMDLENEQRKQIRAEIVHFNRDNDLSKEGYILIFNIISTAVEVSENNYIADSLDLIEKYFRVFYTSLKEEELQGLFAEFLFLYDMQIKGIDCSGYYHNDQNSDFDFYFKKANKYGELKSCINQTNDYIISHKQLNYDISKTFFITVNLWKDENGINILELANLLELKNPEFAERINYYKSIWEKDITVLESKFSISNYEISVYNGVDLPKIEVTGHDIHRIKNIKYILNTSGIESIGIEKFISEIM